jgi:copper chaperone
MDNIVFKTNLRCADCITTMTPILNSLIGEGNWSVDMEHPDKLVTVCVADPGHTIKVGAAFEKAGYNAEAFMPAP